MDSEISQAAMAYKARVPAGRRTHPCHPAKHEPRFPQPAENCPVQGEGYCARFTLFVDSAVCAACRSPAPAVRAEMLQRLRWAALKAVYDPPPCPRRSIPIGARKQATGDDEPQVTEVFLCGRDQRKVALANCVLCQADRDAVVEGLPRKGGG